MGDLEGLFFRYAGLPKTTNKKEVENFITKDPMGDIEKKYLIYAGLPKTTNKKEVENFKTKDLEAAFKASLKTLKIVTNGQCQMKFIGMRDLRDLMNNNAKGLRISLKDVETLFNKLDDDLKSPEFVRKITSRNYLISEFRNNPSFALNDLAVLTGIGRHRTDIRIANEYKTGKYKMSQEFDNKIGSELIEKAKKAANLLEEIREILISIPKISKGRPKSVEDLPICTINEEYEFLLSRFDKFLKQYYKPNIKRKTIGSESSNYINDTSLIIEIVERFLSEDSSDMFKSQTTSSIKKSLKPFIDNMKNRKTKAYRINTDKNICKHLVAFKYNTTYSKIEKILFTNTL